MYFKYFIALDILTSRDISSRIFVDKILFMNTKLQATLYPIWSYSSLKI